MALVRLKRAAQITLPAELRKRFNLEEGDYLEAEAVEDGILLKPVSVMDREDARRELRALLDRVHTNMPPSDKTPREQEEDITRIIKELRREDAAARRA
jgi:AbrB family looped-hinge helix DNA binding protein